MGRYNDAYQRWAYVRLSDLGQVVPDDNYVLNADELDLLYADISVDEEPTDKKRRYKRKDRDHIMINLRQDPTVHLPTFKSG